LAKLASHDKSREVEINYNYSGCCNDDVFSARPTNICTPYPAAVQQIREMAG
jgi:hypothetical protein